MYTRRSPDCFGGVSVRLLQKRFAILTHTLRAVPSVAAARRRVCHAVASSDEDARIFCVANSRVVRSMSSRILLHSDFCNNKKINHSRFYVNGGARGETFVFSARSVQELERIEVLPCG